jgi:hypothetical protein
MTKCREEKAYTSEEECLNNVGVAAEGFERLAFPQRVPVEQTEASAHDLIPSI